MMTFGLARAVALGAALAFAGPSLAQTASTTPSAEAVNIKEMKLGAPVFGTDGIKVGEINRIKADADGRVTEIQVTTGGAAGLTADVVSIASDKIASGSKADVKLSVSAADAQRLPVLPDDQKG